MDTPLHKRRWFKWLTGLVVVFLLFISLLPVGIRYAIISWYEDQGVEHVSLEDVNLNLFSGKAAIINMLVKKQGQTALAIDRLEINFDWTPLLKKRSFFPDLKIQQLEVFLQQKADNSIAVAGIDIPKGEKSKVEEDKAKEPWDFGLHSIEILSTIVNVQTPEQKFKLNLDRLALDKLESWSSDVSNIAFDGKVNGANISLHGKMNLFAKQPGFNGKIAIKGLNLSPLQVHLKQHLNKLNGEFDINTKLKVSHIPGKTTTVEANPTIELRNLSVATATQEINQDKLNWQGTINLGLPANEKPPAYVIEGSINSENLDIKPDGVHQYHHDKLGWQGSITSNTDQSVPAIKGIVDGGGITLTHITSQKQLFHTGTLKVADIDMPGLQQIQTGKITLESLRTLFKPEAEKKNQQPALIQAATLDIDGVNVADQKLINIGDIKFNDALIYLHVGADGKLAALAGLEVQPAATPETEATSETETKPVAEDEKQEGEQTTESASEPVPSDSAAEQTAETEQKPLALVLKSFSLTGNSKIRVLDESVKPVFKTQMKFKTATIGELNTSKPDQASPFKIFASLDKYSSIDLQGEAWPFASPLSLKLKTKIKNISLPPVTSYSRKAIGYDLRAGQLNADSDLKITKGKIDATNKLLISNLELKPGDQKKADQLDSAISMPLDSALSFLRNKQNDIKLELPIAGDIQNPDFDISDVINTAIGTALKKTAMTYLTLALQPYGALIALKQMADAASNAVSLSPLEFDPNLAAINQAGNDYAGKIANLLKERPQLRIKLCGKAVEADRARIISDKREIWLLRQQAIIKKKKLPPAEAKKLLIEPEFKVADEDLLKLAHLRADALKEILVNQHKIGAERLFLCQPAIDTDKAGKPRLDIGI